MTLIPPELIALRKRLDRLDTDILKLIAKRQKIVASVGEIKKKHRMAITDKHRERLMMAHRHIIGKTLGISTQCVNDVFRLLIREAKNIEKDHV